MKYETTTTVLIEVPDKTKSSTVNQCYDIFSVLDIGIGDAPYPESTSSGVFHITDRNQTLINDTWKNVLENLSSELLFNSTFTHDNMFSAPSEDQLNYRFIKYPWVCYIHDPDPLEERSHEEITYNKHIIVTDKPVRLFLSNQESIPYQELESANDILLSNKSCYSVKGYTIKISKQSYPFSNCTPYNSRKFSSSSSSSCYHECLDINYIREYNLSNPMKIFYESETNRERLLNFKTAQSRKDISDKCLSSCPRNDCEFDVYFSSIHKTCQAYFTYGIDYLARSRLEAPIADEPSHDMSLSPKIYLIEVVTYLFGALGTWFGISFIALNPFDLYRWIMESKITDPDDNSYQDNNLKEELIKKDEVIKSLISKIDNMKETLTVISDKYANVENELSELCKSRDE